MNINTRIVTALALAVLVAPGISFAQTTSVAQLQAEIQSLTAQLQSLETELATAGGSTAAWCYTFNSNLFVGMTGNAVTKLQTALQKDGESVTVNGTFDDQTASAVTAFQEKYQSAILTPYGLSYGTGYAGKSTRAELNSLFGCSAGNPNPVTPPIVVNPIVPTSTSPIVSPVSTARNVTATPSSLNVTVAQNSTTNQELTIVAPAGATWSVNTNPADNTSNSWLAVAYAFNCGSAACGNGSVNVVVDAYDGLAVGTYNGSIIISGTFNGSPESIPVTLNVTAQGTTTTTVQPVTIQVDPSTSVAGQIQTGWTGNSLLTFDVTNPNSDPVKVTGLFANTGYYVSSTVNPLGQGTTTGGVEEYNNVTLYNITGGARVLIGTFPSFSLSTSSATFGFNSIIYLSSLVIPADTAGKYLITGDVASYRALPAVVGSQVQMTISGNSIVTPQGVTENIPGTTAIDESTNAIVGVSGYATGNDMTIVQGQ